MAITLGLVTAPLAGADTIDQLVQNTGAREGTVTLLGAGDLEGSVG